MLTNCLFLKHFLAPSARVSSYVWVAPNDKERLKLGFTRRLIQAVILFHTISKVQSF
jgi:hypothetical protein